MLGSGRAVLLVPPSGMTARRAPSGAFLPDFRPPGLGPGGFFLFGCFEKIAIDQRVAEARGKQFDQVRYPVDSWAGRAGVTLKIG